LTVTDRQVNDVLLGGHKPSREHVFLVCCPGKKINFPCCLLSQGNTFCTNMVAKEIRSRQGKGRKILGSPEQLNRMDQTISINDPIVIITCNIQWFITRPFCRYMQNLYGNIVPCLHVSSHA
jgi:hypothetical protein